MTIQILLNNKKINLKSCERGLDRKELDKFKQNYLKECDAYVQNQVIFWLEERANLNLLDELEYYNLNDVIQVLKISSYKWN